MRKVKAALLLLATAGLIQSLYAVGELDDPGPRAIGLGGGGAALVGDAWAGTRNPALAGNSSGRWGAGFSQQFGLPELSREGVSGALAMGPWAIAGYASSFGSEDYRESQLVIGAAREWVDKFASGLSLGYLRADNPLQPGNVVLLTAGFYYPATSSLSMAAVWKQIGSPRVSGLQDRLAESLIAGIVYEQLGRGRLTCDLVQDKRFPLELRTGAEIQAGEKIAMRVGVRTGPVRPSGGLSFRVRRWSFHYGFDLHPDLGASHAVGLEANIRNKP